MKRVTLALVFALSLASSLPARAQSSAPVRAAAATEAYEAQVLELSREATFAIDLSQRANQLSTTDRDPLKVCHSFGMLNSAMIYFAHRVLNGPSSESRKGAVNGVMPLVAELNAFCRVPSNLAAWKPRAHVNPRQPQQDIARRLTEIRAAVDLVRANGML